MLTAACCPGLLYGLSLATASMVFVLVLSGAQVTSYDVGMADATWPSVSIRFWLAESVGLMIEHRHRVFGLAAGLFAIALCATAWLSRAPRLIRALATVALLAVIAQGILGGLRVRLNSWGVGRETAVVHAVSAQAVFAVLISVVVLSGYSWRRAAGKPHSLASNLHTMTTAALVLLFIQIALGAVQRHLGTGFWFHAAGAVAWFMLALWFGFVTLSHADLRSSLGRAGLLLLLLTLVQTALGLAAVWATRLIPPGMGTAPSFWEAAIPSLHLGVGALLVAATVNLFWRTRLLHPVPSADPMSVLMVDPRAKRDRPLPQVETVR